MAEAADFDCCVCGDYRKDHKGGTGPCAFNNDYKSGGLTHGFKKCLSFMFAKAADPNDPNLKRAVEER